MGELKAFYAGTSTAAELTLNGDTKYYRGLLDKAFKTCYIDRRGKGTGSEKIADVTWELLDTGKKDAGRPLLAVKAGSVLQKNLSGIVETLLNHVANEEDKYYYSWYENGATLTDESGEEVLGNLLRVNAHAIGFWIASGTSKNLLVPLGIEFNAKSYIPISITGDTKQGQHISLCAEATPPFFMDLDNTAVMYTKGSNGKYAAASSKDTCFYRVYNNELVGFWAEVVGLESGGGGGGAMRADKVDEVDYRWTGNKALGIALGLEVTRKVDQKVIDVYFPPATQYQPFKLTVTNLINQGYVVTNVPWHKSAAPKVGKGVTTPNTETAVVRTEALNFMGSEILYLKKFKVNGVDMTLDFNLGVAPQDIDALKREVERRIKEKPEKLFDAAFPDAGKWLEGVRSGAFKWTRSASEETGKVLRHSYGQTKDQATQSFKAAGYSLEERTKALHTAYPGFEVAFKNPLR